MDRKQDERDRRKVHLALTTARADAIVADVDRIGEAYRRELVGKLLLLWNQDFLMAFGVSENTIDYGVAYMNIYALGTIFVQLTLGMNAFITAQGFAKTGMLSAIIVAVATIIIYFPGHVLYMGSGISVRKENTPEDPPEKSSAGIQNCAAKPGSGAFFFYYAGQ